MGDTDDAGGEGVQERIGEDGVRAVGGAGVVLEIGGHQEHGHAEGGGVADLHADAVVGAGAVDDGGESADAAQALLVEFEQPSALDVGDEGFLVGVAEGEEDVVLAGLEAEVVGELGGEGAVVGGEEPVGEVVHRAASC